MLGEQRDVALACAQRRQGDHFERQPVEQIGAELALVDLRRKILVGGRDDAHVDRDRLGRADAGDLAIFDARSSRSCAGIDKVPSSSRNKVPPSASSKRPWRVLAAPVKLPASWPNSSASIRFSGRAAQFMMISGPGPARRQMVQALGDQLLAGAALADDEHRAVERRGAARALDRVEERQALADELIRPLHTPHPKSGRLLVVNPTIWQGFSSDFRLSKWAISASQRFRRIWHGSCMVKGRFRALIVAIRSD